MQENTNTEEVLEQDEVLEETDTEAVEEAEAEAEAESEDTEEGKKIFGKKNKKDKKDEKIEELEDRVKRQMAEFENFRKRSEKEKSQMYEVGAKSIIEKVLPIVDNFERGLAQGDEADPFVDGMNKIYKQLMTSLEEAGVTAIEALGKEFEDRKSVV